LLSSSFSDEVVEEVEAASDLETEPEPEAEPETELEPEPDYEPEFVSEPEPDEPVIEDVESIGEEIEDVPIEQESTEPTSFHMHDENVVDETQPVFDGEETIGEPMVKDPNRFYVRDLDELDDDDLEAIYHPRTEQRILVILPQLPWPVSSSRYRRRFGMHAGTRYGRESGWVGHRDTSCLT